MNVSVFLYYYKDCKATNYCLRGWSLFISRRAQVNMGKICKRFYQPPLQKQLFLPAPPLKFKYFHHYPLPNTSIKRYIHSSTNKIVFCPMPLQHTNPPPKDQNIFAGPPHIDPTSPPPLINIDQSLIPLELYIGSRYIISINQYFGQII